MPKSRVLLLDDDALTLQVLRDMVEAAGFEATTHTSPLAALAAVECEHPEVIVADFFMPEMNGIAFLEMAVARSPESARILCTACADFSVAMHAINTGHVHHLVPKPTRRDEFIAAVRQAADNVRLRRENEALTEALRRQNLHLEEMVRERTEALLQGFVASLDARDSDTKSHSRRVAQYTNLLARHLGIADADLTVVERGALLHDVGKIGIPDRVLLKRGPLSNDEWLQMRKHPELGWALLQRVDYLREASSIVLQHHERWDGSGYPAGLSGEQIAVGARVFQVVDAYDAITTDRPYRQRMPHDSARHELMRGSGSQFDPAIVEAFLSVPPAEWQRIREDVDLISVRESFIVGDWRRSAEEFVAAAQKIGVPSA